MGKQDIQYAFERSALWRLKLHLQHTGWLQFVPPLIIGQFFIFASRILEWYLLTSVSSAALLLCTIGNLLLAIGIFDIITLKFNIRPSESIPGLLYDNNKDLSVMQQRRSCRSFQPRKLCKKHREEILRVAKAASKDTLGTSSPIRFEYIDSPLKVWPAVNSQEYLVAVGPAKYDRMAMIDVGRSLQNVVIHATKMGLATCWIGPGADHDSIIQAMETRGILYGDSCHIVCVCAIGYKSFLVPTMVRIAMKLISSTRKPYNELFFSDIKFQQSLDITTYPFNRYTKCYEAARSSPSSFNAQPTQCVGIWDKDTDTIRFDFFSSIKSRYYAPVAAGIWLSDWQIACQCVGIEGRFAVLSQEERGINECDESLPVLPYYNVSWIEKCGWPKDTELSKKDVQM